MLLLMTGLDECGYRCVISTLPISLIPEVVVALRKKKKEPIGQWSCAAGEALRGAHERRLAFPLLREIISAWVQRGVHVVHL